MAKVLVVDDSKDTTDSFALLLRAWGHEVACAYDGDAAVELAAGFKPDAALVDNLLPGRGSNDVARELRRMQGSGRILLVSITGYARGDKGGPSADFDVLLLKPADPRELRRILDSLATHP